MALTPGATFAGYTIIRLLGTGGMGEVYLARHPRLPREDALKILNPAVTADPDYRLRFEREADVVAGLWHPHIVGIHDRGESDGQLWIAMDYVNGANAAELLQAQPAGLPPESVVAIISAVAEALDYAHDRHLLHRDVKPANILVADEPSGRRILLADFGIARRDDDSDGLTATNMTVGTVAYSAPEQLMGRPIDGRADQYALAATAFHLLTGTPPFHDPNQAVVISRHLTAEPPRAGSHRPELAALDPALAKALSKDPADRYARCTDFARALAHGTGATATVAETRLAGAAVPADRRGRRRVSRAAIAALVAVVGLIVVAGAFAAGQFSGDREAASRATATTATPTTTSPTAAATPTTDIPAPTVTTAPTASATPTTPAPVSIGAACSPPGATGSTAEGAAAYCANLQYTDRYLWSMSPGEIPNPVLSTSPVSPPPYEEESPVQVCMQQTGHGRLRCMREVRRGDTP